MEKSEFVFGIRATIEAINSGKEIDRILVKKGLQGETYQELSVLIRRYQIPVQFVPVERIDRVTRKNHQGVVAFVSAISYYNIENIVPQLYEEGGNPLILVLDQVSDVRNFGAIARTAEVAGVDAIVIPEKGAAQINADALKTSAGALHTVRVCRSKNLAATVKFLKNSGLRIVAATEKGKELHFQTNMKDPLAIIMGAEDRGIEAELLKMADDWTRIPQFGQIGSLNVSVAAGVLIYEAIRQRQSSAT